MRGRCTFLAILAIAAALFAPDQSPAAVATGPANHFNLIDGHSLFGRDSLIPHQIIGAKDTTSAHIEETIYTFCLQADVWLNVEDPQVYVESYDTVTEGGMRDYYLTGYAAWLYTKALDAIGAGPYDSGSEITQGVGGDPGNTFEAKEFIAIQIGIWAGMISKQNDSDIVDGPPGTAGIAKWELVGSNQSQLKDVDDSTLDCCENWANILENLGLHYGDFFDEVAEADRNNVGGVRVARLGGAGTSFDDVQDHLLIIEGPPAVPEPATLAIWSVLGLVGCVAQRRKRHTLRAT